MCPRMTKPQCIAFAAYELSFESAGALACVNAGSGPAAPAALYRAFAARQLASSLPTRLVSLEVIMTRLPLPECAALIGLDWAAATHAIGLQAAGSDTRESGRVAHTPEALDAWARALRSRFGGQPMAVGLELTTGPSVAALRTPDCWVLFPGNALTVATDRQAFTPRRAQDDPADAELQREGRLKHRDKLPGLTPPGATRRPRDHRVECRRRLVEDQVRLTNRLTSALNNDCAPVWSWCSDHDTTLFCAFLTPWPPLNAVQQARRAPLERCGRQPHGQTRGIAPRLQAINSASPLTTDAGGITPPVGLVRALVAQLRVTLQAIDDGDHAMAPLAPTPPACARFQARPGAGPVCAPRLLGAVGEPRAREASASALQPSAGMAPVPARRGHTCRVHGRLQGATFLRQPVVAWASASIRHACWARASSAPPRAQGRTHQAATRARAFQWIVSCLVAGTRTHRTTTPPLSRPSRGEGHP
jgi:hypothetical protein